jgi:DNA-binding NarL/FixJ family response regulator
MVRPFSAISSSTTSRIKKKRRGATHTHRALTIADERRLFKVYRSHPMINTIRKTPPTPREREVILLIRRGLLNKQIAHVLNIAEGTVKVHLKNISRKYGLKNRLQIALMFTRT